MRICVAVPALLMDTQINGGFALFAENHRRVGILNEEIVKDCVVSKRIAIYATAGMATYRSTVEVFRFVRGGRVSDVDDSPL